MNEGKLENYLNEDCAVSPYLIISYSSEGFLYMFLEGTEGQKIEFDFDYFFKIGLHEIGFC